MENTTTPTPSFGENLKQTIIGQALEAGACREAIGWLKTQPTVEDIVKNCPKKWRLWALNHLKFLKQCSPELLHHFTQLKEWWEEFDGWDWAQLLEDQPQFADLCSAHGGWQKFDGWDWAWLLSKQPQFAPQCSANGGWEKFYDKDWKWLIERQPQFAEKRDAIVRR